ncbi:SseB family protein [Solwaraspora sp. WMMB335]|uniref:SseB family protein n=1 Tax=Solwaraspora sp. WMMB335 TaxID=3404118 RepID=UPI003B94596B
MSNDLVHADAPASSTAVPAQTLARRPEVPWSPANTSEQALSAAIVDGDLDRYVAVLATTRLLVLVHPAQRASAQPPRWRTAVEHDRTLVVAFTSRDAMRTVTGRIEPHLLLEIGELAAGWPDPGWGLAVDPGLPIGSRLPQHVIHQLATLAGGATGAAGLGGAGDRPAAGQTPKPKPKPVPVIVESPRWPESPRRPAVPTVQVLLTADQVTRYLDDGHDRVSGLAYRTPDVAGLGPSQLVGLPGGPPQARLADGDARSVHVVRWLAFGERAFRRLEGGRPRWAVAGARLPDGARLIRILADGSEQAVGEFDAVAHRWRRDGPPAIDPLRGSVGDGWLARYRDVEHLAVPGPKGVYLFPGEPGRLTGPPQLVDVDGLQSLTYLRAVCRWRGIDYTVVGVHQGWLRLEHLAVSVALRSQIERVWAPQVDVENPYFIEVDAFSADQWDNQLLQEESCM